jgi:protein HIRA/HIR1
MTSAPSQIHASTSRTTPPPSPPRAQQPQVGFGPAVNGVGGEQINKLVAKRGNKNKDKKRIQPTLMSTIPSASNTINGAGPSNSGLQFGQSSMGDLKPHLSHSVSMSGTTLSHPPQSATRNAFPSSASDGFNVPIDVDVDFPMGMDMDVPIDSLATSSIRQGKRKATAIDLTDDSTRNGKPRTLGGDRPREVGVVKEIGGGMARQIVAPMTLGGDVIPLPPIVTYLCVECGEDLFEGRNSENLGTYLTFFSRDFTSAS